MVLQFIQLHLCMLEILSALIELHCCWYSGSADRTVKFWDLETFEMIGSARREVFEFIPFRQPFCLFFCFFSFI